MTGTFLWEVKNVVVKSALFCNTKVKEVLICLYVAKPLMTMLFFFLFFFLSFVNSSTYFMQYNPSLVLNNLCILSLYYFYL